MHMLIRGLFAALALSAFACTAQEPAPKFQEGMQYKKVREATPPADRKRIEVAEFFSYGCPHCYSLDPLLEDWKKTKPADVDFVRVPHSLGSPTGMLYSKAMYTHEALNVSDKMHKALFEAIHQQHQSLASQETIAEVFNRHTGILPEVFAGTFNGFAVDARVRRAEQFAKTYAISGVPAVVVGNTYVTSGTMSGGGFPAMIKVIDFLVDKVRKERAGK